MNNIRFSFNPKIDDYCRSCASTIDEHVEKQSLADLQDMASGYDEKEHVSLVFRILEQYNDYHFNKLAFFRANPFFKGMNADKTKAIVSTNKGIVEVEPTGLNVDYLRKNDMKKQYFDSKHSREGITFAPQSKNNQK